jgi:hypothetical protein
MEIDAYAFIDPTGLVPVVNEVEWLRPPPLNGCLHRREVGGRQPDLDSSITLARPAYPPPLRGYTYPTRLLDAGR